MFRFSCSAATGSTIPESCPACTHRSRKTSLMSRRAGIPNDTFEAPHVMLSPCRWRIRRMVSIVVVAVRRIGALGRGA